MKTYNFNRMAYGGEIEKISLIVPDDIKFCVYDKYNDRQQFIMFVTYYDKKLYDELYDINSKYMYCINVDKLGNLIIGHLHNVQPLNELPCIELDELNNLYKDDLNDMYVEFYKYVESNINIPIGELSNDEFITKTPIEFTPPKKINIETYHLKKIINGSSNNGNPYILSSIITYNDWFYNDEINHIRINKISIDNLMTAFGNTFKLIIVSKENTVDEINKAQEKFKNRVTEIINKL